MTTTWSNRGTMMVTGIDVNPSSMFSNPQFIVHLSPCTVTYVKDIGPPESLGNSLLCVLTGM